MTVIDQGENTHADGKYKFLWTGKYLLVLARRILHAKYIRFQDVSRLSICLKESRIDLCADIEGLPIDSDHL